MIAPWPLDDAEETLPTGALRLADLGFFDLELFRLLGEADGYWLSRLKVGMTINDAATGDRLDLLAVLRRVPPGATLELAVLLGAKARLVARVLAVGVPQVVADERRRELRE